MLAAQDPSGDSGARALHATHFARLVAFLVDLVLIAAVVLWLRVAAIHGFVRPLGAWRPGGSEGWIDARAIGVVLLGVALRDVPFGASLAKWLLCLRVVGTDGLSLPIARRLARALAWLDPVSWFRAVRGRPAAWSVVGYTPSTRGLVVRTVLTAAAAITSIVWGLETQRPSIGRHDAEHLARATVLMDPGLRTQAGEPLDCEVLSVTPRNRLVTEGRGAEFRLRVRGSRQRQDMVVRAVKVAGHWAVDEIVDIQILALDASGHDTVAVR